MSTRLALVNCHGPYEGVWTRAKGNEFGLEVFKLGEGALIRFDWMTDESTDSAFFHESGEHSLPARGFSRYRVSKVGKSAEPTIVRVLLNGKS